jgi:Saxitoxin biosynthesis operon protein SxtJ
MGLFQLRLKPSDSELRWFAGLWFPALCGMIGWLVFRRMHAPVAAMVLWGAGTAISLSGLLFPAVILPIYQGIMRLTFPVGWVMSHVVLAVGYFLVITPVGCVMRIFHDPMQRRFEHSAQSYWIPRERPEQSRYFRQT